jgi:hypothetical protein
MADRQHATEAVGSGGPFQPASAYEVVTRGMVNGLAEDVKEIRDRINGLFWLIAGAVVVDLLMRVTGLGA